jgi:hypothetical protein
MPLETRPVASAGPQAIVGTSGAPPRVTSALKTTSNGRSGANANRLRALKPDASRYSSTSSAGEDDASSEAALGLNSACASVASTALSSVTRVNGFAEPAGAFSGL